MVEDLLCQRLGSAAVVFQMMEVGRHAGFARRIGSYGQEVYALGRGGDLDCAERESSAERESKSIERAEREHWRKRNRGRKLFLI